MSCGNTGFISADEARKNSRNYATIFSEICAIQQAIVAAMDSHLYSAIVNNNTVFTSTAGITAITVTNGGSNYFPIEASVDFTHSNGTGATATLSLNGGTITSINMVAGGSGYEPISASISGVDRITNIDASITVTSVGGGGDITAVNIVDGGQGYHVGDELNITDGTGADISVGAIGSLGEITALVITSGGSGYLVTSTVTVDRIVPVDAVLSPVVSTTGEISFISIASGGSAYHVGDEIFIAHPVGSGAFIQVSSVSATGAILGATIITAGTDYQTEVAKVVVTHPTGIAFNATTTVVAGSITGVTIIDGGIGYNPLLPSITITDSTGSGATFAANVVAGSVDSIEVLTKGSNYTQAATVNITPAPTSSGSGATAIAAIETSNVSSIYYEVYNNTRTSREITDQIDYILSYFSNIGYNIRLQTNPATTNTLQWFIQW